MTRALPQPQTTGLAGPRWYRAERCAGGRWPRHLTPWLRDAGSLTERLTRLGGGDFRVEVLCQRPMRPGPAERRRLGLGPRQWVLGREVVLHGRGRPWVFARSLVPLASLNGRLRQLRWLADRPLGGFLFRQPDLEREPMEVAELAPGRSPVPGRLQAGERLWGRRSVFWLAGRPLLVMEVFLPPFVEDLSA